MVTIEGASGDVGDEGGELVRAAGRGHRGAPDVVIEVEIGVVDPHRDVQPERHLDEAVAQRRHEVQPGFEERPHPGVERARGRGRGVDDRDAQDVHVRRRRFQSEERGVEAGQTLHRPSSFAGIVGPARGPGPGRRVGSPLRDTAV
jgi:hypothetical protein